ncbi:MAG TPA: carbohydrate-binding family 9-like protein [Spirochaetia bacterium]|nr:carbohydrate-binding family 9-like protein [Spirochaetia bacterium]
MGGVQRSYTVRRCSENKQVTGLWDDPEWKRTVSLTIDNSMEEHPSYVPVTEAKLLYNDTRIHVIFRVEDRYVRTRRQAFQDDVWNDSCVEFFFTPSADRATGYFNLEMNAGGVMLFHHRQNRTEGIELVRPEDGKRIEIKGSLPRINDPEIPGPLVWTIEYAIPYEVISRYTIMVRPAPGVLWYANFYKCADESSHPHWFTWNPIASERPDFHRKECFGILAFA